MGDSASSLCRFVTRFVVLFGVRVCYQEAEIDCKALSVLFGAKVFLGPQLNPFRSLMPMIDPIFNARVYSVNQYIMVAQGQRTSNL